MKLNAIGQTVLVFVSILFGAVSSSARADDDPAAESARVSKMTADELKNWVIRVGNDEGRPAKVGRDLVLRYSNPGVGRVYGDVYLFTVEGRPEVIVSIYKWFTPYTGFEAEMQSLSTSKLRGERDGREVWRPDRPGLEMKDVPEAPTPGPSAVERMAQMRSIAGSFAGRLVDSRVGAKVDGRVEVTGEDQSLRLLPKPLYRYEPGAPDRKDGGLFAYVVGTDPEFFLLLEARETPQGLRWQYGLARMNSDPLQVTFKGKEVWKVEKIANRHDPRGTYFSMELPQGASNR